MRPTAWITVALIAVAISGCATFPGRDSASPAAAPTLLFDAVPGWPAASDMACRSSWPAVPSYRDAGEVVWYRERFLDVQSGGWGSGRPTDRVTRRFDTFRTGRLAR